MAEAIPKISVVVPAHNAGNSLDACIDALVASDFSRDNWELIVVDDASTDNTKEIANRADVFLSVGGGPRGPAYARNRGAEQARASVVAFVDSDVCVRSDALTRIFQTLEENPDVAAVFGSYDDAPTAESSASQYRNLLHHYVHQQSAGESASFWAGLGAVRRDAFLSAGMFDERRYNRPQIEDVELGYRLRAKGNRILLDAAICGTHLKDWKLPQIVRTDLVHRGIPWVRLLLERGPSAAAGGPSLGRLEIASVGFVGLAVLLFVLWPIAQRTEFVIAALVALAVSTLLSSHFHLWMLRSRGAKLAVLSVPLYLLYKLTSVVSVVAGTTLFLFTDSEPRSSADSLDRSVRPTRSFVGYATGEAGSRVIAFIATAYIARRLGPISFGYLGFATAVVAYFGTALSTGISEVGSREVALRPADANAIAAAGTIVRFGAAAIGLVAVAAISTFVPEPPVGRLVLALTGLSLISLALDTGWVFKGLGRARRVGTALLFSQLIAVALLLSLINRAEDVARVPLIQFVADLTAATFLAAPLLSRAWLAPKLSTGFGLLRRSGLITVSRFFRTLIVSVDVVLLGVIASSAQVGLYSAAYRIVFFVMAVSYASHISWLPVVTRAIARGDRPDDVIAGSLRLAVSVTLPFVVGGILIAPQLLAAIFGDNYAHAATALKLLMVSLFFIALHGASRNFFLATERLGVETLIVASGVVVNVVLNLILIPRYGLDGAAFATAAADGAILAVCAVVVVAMGVRLQLKPLIIPLAAGLVMAFGLMAIGVTRPAVFTVPAGAIIYGAALTLLTRFGRSARAESRAAYTATA